MTGKFKVVLAIGLCLATAFAFTACGGAGQETGDSADPLKVTCNNGVMLGQEENGVVSYKGVPYAEPPVGDLRWKAPVAAADSDEEIECYEFGDTALQYEWPTEPASYSPKSEDCLTLNIWTSSQQTDEPKSVMVWFHGGAYAWGGTTDPMYDGQNFVEAHPEIVLVTCNYRLGLMSWADFSDIPGGEEYTDVNLGIRDHICALEWIQNNIEGFGGDKNNVTIFGESAGGWSTTALVASPMAKGLFNKAIVESGGLVPKDRDAAKEFAKYIMEAAGAENMNDLLAIDGDKWMELDATEWIGDETCGVVIDGEVIPEDFYGAIEDAAKSGVKLLLGTNADEWNYFQADSEGDTDAERFASWKEGLDEYWDAYAEDNSENMDKLYDMLGAEVDKKFADYTGDADVKDALIKSAFITETWRYEHIKLADAFSKAGDAFMYYWDVPSTKDEYYKSACHAIELAYVLNNLEDDIYAGEVDADVAAKAQEAWVNFAKTGDPSIDGTAWDKYSQGDRNTMVIKKDGWETVKDPNPEVTEILTEMDASFDVF